MFSHAVSNANLPRATRPSSMKWLTLTLQHPPCVPFTQVILWDHIVQTMQTLPLYRSALAYHNWSQADKITLRIKTAATPIVTGVFAAVCLTAELVLNWQAFTRRRDNQLPLIATSLRLFRAIQVAPAVQCGHFLFSFFFFLERANTYHRVQTEGLVVQLYVGHFVNSCTVLCIAGSFK